MPDEKHQHQPPDLRDFVLGCESSHVQSVQGDIQLHPEVIPDWRQLVRAADREGFQLLLASGFRSFRRQLLIWNDKLAGLRPVLDDHGEPVHLDELDELQRVEAVLRWSALPGTSRHHWGTDMDIYDAGAVAKDYPLQLIPEEYNGCGPFAAMIKWLHQYLQQPEAPAFFFPYTLDRGGIRPEPWHLSHAPVARQFQRCWTLQLLKQQLLRQQQPEQQRLHCRIESAAVILEHLDNLYARFIKPSIMAGFHAEMSDTKPFRQCKTES